MADPGSEFEGWCVEVGGHVRIGDFFFLRQGNIMGSVQSTGEGLFLGDEEVSFSIGNGGETKRRGTAVTSS